MIKKLGSIFLAIILLFNFGVGLAAVKLEIIAPHGGEFDLQQKVMKYHGSNSQPVEVRWKDPALEADKLQGKAIRKPLPSRVLKAFELTVNLNQNYIVASKDVVLKYDENTSATCNLLEWDRGIALMKISGEAMIAYKDWTIKGNRIECQLDKGAFTVFGPVEAFNKLNTIHGGKLIFDRGIGKAIISDNALLIRGKDEMAASEISYFFDTNQVLASGTVKTKIIDEKQ